MSAGVTGMWFLAAVASPVIAAAAGDAAAERRQTPFALNAIALGASGQTDLAMGMLEARATLSPLVLATLAPTLVAVDGAGVEHQLRAALTFRWGAAHARFDDRNLWVFSDSGTTRYRNRLRLTVPVDVAGREWRIQLLNEAFYETGGRGWFRNLLGAGAGCELARVMDLDAYLMLQDDDHRGRSPLLLMMLTAHLF